MKSRHSTKSKAKKDGLSKAEGALLGCAVGDALGITQEIFVERPNHHEYTLEQVLRQRKARKAGGLQTEVEGGSMSPWSQANGLMTQLCFSACATASYSAIQ